ncbi:MAG: Ppx/GppA family phosphatase, partial [Actinomycetota bacterium]
MADQPLAVIDIGSNSGRMLVARSPTGEHVEVLAEERVPLRLARELRDSDKIGTDAIDRTIESIRDFLTLAKTAGVVRTLAVATAAVREASNATELLERIHRETGLEIEIVDGDREAALAFLGAVHSLPIEDGVLVDVGGGSVEIARFRGRRLEHVWT